MTETTVPIDPFWIFFAWCLTITGVSFVLIGYFDRLLASVVCFFTGFYFRRSRALLTIESIKISPLRGRILFKKLRYQSVNQCIKIVDGHVSFRYWRLNVDKNYEETKSLFGRIHLNLRGVQWFIYNRTPAYNYVETELEKVMNPHAVQPVKKRETSEAKPDAFYLRILPISFEIAKGAVIIGNSYTTSLLALDFHRGSGSYKVYKSRSPLDLGKYVLELNLNKPKVQLRDNPDFQKHPLNFPDTQIPWWKRWLYGEDGGEDDRGSSTTEKEWHGLQRYHKKRNKSDANENYAKVSKVIEAQSVWVKYYSDDAGVARKGFDSDNPFHAANGDFSPEWGVELTFNNTTLRYGPWANIERNVIMEFFYPFARRTFPPTRVPEEGEARVNIAMNVHLNFVGETIWRIPTREKSKDYKYATDDKKRPYGWLEFRFLSGTTCVINIPMVYYSHGYTTSVELKSPGVSVFSSVNYTELLVSQNFKFSMSMASPREWNALYKYKVSLSIEEPNVYLLRDHVTLMQDLMTDWSSGPPWQFDTFLSYRYDISVILNKMKLFLCFNENNIISQPNDLEDNCFIVIDTDAASIDVELPFDQFDPIFSHIGVKFNVRDLKTELSLPKSNTVGAFLMSDRKMLTCKELAGKFDYEFRNIAESVEQKDHMNLEVTLNKVDVLLFGYFVRACMLLKENYAGQFMSFCTLDEFKQNSNMNKNQSPLFAYDYVLETYATLTLKDVTVLLPENLFDHTDVIEMKIQEFVLETTVSEDHMDIQLNATPIVIEHQGDFALLDGFAANVWYLFAGIKESYATYLSAYQTIISEVRCDCRPAFLRSLMCFANCFNFLLLDKDNSIGVESPEDLSACLVDLHIGSVNAFVHAGDINLIRFTSSLRLSVDLEGTNVEVPNLLLQNLFLSKSDENDAGWSEIGALETCFKMSHQNDEAFKTRQKEHITKLDTGKRCAFLYDGKQNHVPFFVSLPSAMPSTADQGTRTPTADDSVKAMLLPYSAYLSKYHIISSDVPNSNIYGRKVPSAYKYSSIIESGSTDFIKEDTLKPPDLDAVWIDAERTRILVTPQLAESVELLHKQLNDISAESLFDEFQINYLSKLTASSTASAYKFALNAPLYIQAFQQIPNTPYNDCLMLHIQTIVQLHYLYTDRSLLEWSFGALEVSVKSNRSSDAEFSVAPMGKTTPFPYTLIFMRSNELMGVLAETIQKKYVRLLNVDLNTIEVACTQPDILTEVKSFLNEWKAPRFKADQRLQALLGEIIRFSSETDCGDPLFMVRPSNLWRLRAKAFQSSDDWMLLCHFRHCLNVLKQNSSETLRKKLPLAPEFEKLVQLLKPWHHWEMNDLNQNVLLLYLFKQKDARLISAIHTELFVGELSFKVLSEKLWNNAEAVGIKLQWKQVSNDVVFNFTVDDIDLLVQPHLPSLLYDLVPSTREADSDVITTGLVGVGRIQLRIEYDQMNVHLVSKHLRLSYDPKSIFFGFNSLHLNAGELLKLIELQLYDYNVLYSDERKLAVFGNDLNVFIPETVINLYHYYQERLERVLNELRRKLPKQNTVNQQRKQLAIDVSIAQVQLDALPLPSLRMNYTLTDVSVNKNFGFTISVKKQAIGFEKVFVNLPSLLVSVADRTQISVGKVKAVLGIEMLDGLLTTYKLLALDIADLLDLRDERQSELVNFDIDLVIEGIQVSLKSDAAELLVESDKINAQLHARKAIKFDVSSKLLRILLLDANAIGQLELNFRGSNEAIIIEHVISLLKADFSDKFSAYVEFFKREIIHRMKEKQEEIKLIRQHIEKVMEPSQEVKLDLYRLSVGRVSLALLLEPSTATPIVSNAALLFFKQFNLLLKREASVSFKSTLKSFAFLFIDKFNQNDPSHYSINNHPEMNRVFVSDLHVSLLKMKRIIVDSSEITMDSSLDIFAYLAGIRKLFTSKKPAYPSASTETAQNRGVELSANVQGIIARLHSDKHASSNDIVSLKLPNFSIKSDFIPMFYVRCVIQSSLACKNQFTPVSLRLLMDFYQRLISYMPETETNSNDTPVEAVQKVLMAFSVEMRASSLGLTCLPLSKVEFLAELGSLTGLGFLTSTGLNAQIILNDFSFKLRHEYAPEDCVHLLFDRVTYSQGCLGGQLSQNVLLSDVKLKHNIRHLQDLFLFLFYYKPLLAQTDSNASQGGEKNVKQSKYLNLRMTRFDATADLTQAIGKVSLHVENLKFRLSIYQDLAESLHFSCDLVEAKSEGRLSGIIGGLINPRLTSLSKPVQNEGHFNIVSLKVDRVLTLLEFNLDRILVLDVQPVEFVLKDELKEALVFMIQGSLGHLHGIMSKNLIPFVLRLSEKLSSLIEEKKRHAAIPFEDSHPIPFKPRSLDLIRLKGREYPLVCDVMLKINDVRLAFFKEQFDPFQDCIQITSESLLDELNRATFESIHREITFALAAKITVRKGHKRDEKKYNDVQQWSITRWNEHVSSRQFKLILDVPLTEVYMDSYDKGEAIDYSFETRFGGAIDVNLNIGFFKFFQEIANEFGEQYSESLRQAKESLKAQPTKFNARKLVIEPQFKVIEGATPNDLLRWLGVNKEGLPANVHNGLTLGVESILPGLLAVYERILKQ